MRSIAKRIMQRVGRPRIGKAPKPLVRILEKHGLSGKIAQECKITRQAVSQWRRIPSDKVLKVEKVTGIPRSELRPDLYPQES